MYKIQVSLQRNALKTYLEVIDSLGSLLKITHKAVNICLQAVEAIHEVCEVRGHHGSVSIW